MTINAEIAEIAEKTTVIRRGPRSGDVRPAAQAGRVESSAARLRVLRSSVVNRFFVCFVTS